MVLPIGQNMDFLLYNSIKRARNPEVELLPPLPCQTQQKNKQNTSWGVNTNLDVLLQV